MASQSRFRSASSASRNPLGVLNGDNDNLDQPSRGVFSKRRASNDVGGNGAHRWLFGGRKYRSVSSPSHLGPMPNKQALTVVGDNFDDDKDDANVPLIQGVSDDKLTGHLVREVDGGSTRAKPSVVATTLAKSDRIVCFDGIPGEVGLNSILAQVCGGPLERVVAVPEDSSNPRIVQLHFFQAQDAQAFYEYTMSGRFLINGTGYRPRWGNASLAAVYAFPKVVFDEMVYSNARRCICLTMRHRDRLEREAAAATIGATGACPGRVSSVKPMVSSRNVTMDVSLEAIARDFGRFGPVLSITPLILNHVNIAVQYADTRHAIRAKKAFERKSDAGLSARYAGWSVSYGKDPADRRVPVPL